MSWGRMDDGFHDHPKVEPLSLDAIGLWTLCWSVANRHRKTAPVPGFVTESTARGEAAKHGVTGRKFATLLAELTTPPTGRTVGLWEPSEGGWLIHDYADYMPKRRDPDELAEAGRRGGKARAIAKQTAKQMASQELSKQQADVQANTQANSSSRVSARAFPSRPVPEDDPSGGGDRHLPAREASTTDPPPRCAKHPEGNPTDEPCAGCARLREWDERQATRQREQARRIREQCPDCGGSGWTEDDQGHPTRKCDHRRALAAS